jgi:phosphoglycerate kinase
MFAKQTIRDIDVKGKRVLVRVDFNVPMTEADSKGERKVADDTRIRAALPTINYLIEQQAIVILCSHLGRPKGERSDELTLRPVSEYLADLIPVTVRFADDCIGSKVEDIVTELKPGEVLVLENTRFHAGEKDNDPTFAKALASLAEVFVNDAFGTAHRAHASNAGVTEFLPAVAGFLLEKEIRYLGEMLLDPERPFISILGGKKISDKIEVIHSLLAKSDQVLIGGGMANTFFKAQGYPIGDSLVEDDVLEIARNIVVKGGDRLRLPVDVVIADRFDEQASHRVMEMGPVPEGWQILDIGPQTVQNFTKSIEGAGTVVWNGPMGVFEFPPFAPGTFRVAKAVAECGGTTIIGGGDSIAAIRQAGITGKIGHISTGGGAFMEMLEGKELPGVATLLDSN